jgi:hypothetical protein
MSEILNKVIQYVLGNANFVVPEDPADPENRGWQAVALASLDHTVVTPTGKVLKFQVPDFVTAWGERIDKRTCALVWGPGASFGADRENLRAYLVQVVQDANGEIAARPLALFSRNQEDGTWFLNTNPRTLRWGAASPAANVSAASRTFPLDSVTASMIIGYLQRQAADAEQPGAIASGESFVPISLV